MNNQIEAFIREYFINNNIPLFTPRKIDTVKFTVYGRRAANCTSSPVTTFTKKYFPNKPKNIYLYNYILYISNKKYCSNCNLIKELTDFNNNKTNNLSGKDGWCTECKSNYRILNKEQLKETAKLYYIKDYENCKERSKNWAKNNRGKRNAITRNYQAAKLQRTPAWADKEAIKFFYECCPADCHVDHIIPLQGKNISGLHIETNLQWLPAKENLSKGNRMGGIT